MDTGGHTIPTIGDWNGDKRPDLLLGCDCGKLFAFENRGTTSTPDWYPITFPAFEAYQRRYSAPHLLDIDGDGDLDILVGNETGRIELILNHGSPSKPDWKLQSLYLGAIDVGDHSVPIAFDIDQDKDLDLLVGNGKGHLIFYLNEGSPSTPQFVLKNTRFSQNVFAANIVPQLFDWANDGIMDLLIGEKEGSIYLLRNQPTPGIPLNYGWKLEELPVKIIDNSHFVAPAKIDWNQDQKPDLLIGDDVGNLRLFLNQGFKLIEEKIPVSQSLTEVNETPEPVAESKIESTEIKESESILKPDAPIEPKYVLISEKYAGLSFGNRAVPAFVDIDQDQDLDLFVGTKEGKLYQYTNEGTPETPEWVLATAQLLPYNIGQNITPTFIDLDQDGDWDLVIGNETGRISYWENRGSAEVADFTLNSLPFISVTGGQNAKPTFLDLNGDGQLDLLIGNFRGQLISYIQTSTPQGIGFQLTHRKYLDLDIGIGATPTVADINNDHALEIIIGSDRGTLWTCFLDSSNPWGWKIDPKALGGLKLPVGSFPVFVDIDHDGDQDLFVGTESGVIYFYRNDGTSKQ